MGEHKRLSVVIPTLNEQENIEELFRRLDTALRRDDFEYEAIVVDDRSTDLTEPIVRELGKRYPIRLMSKSGSLGKAQSLLQGFEAARYDLVAMIDADLQYAPEYLPAMARKIDEGADIVVGNRKVHKESLRRRIMSLVFSFFFIRLLHGLDLDTQSGLKVFKKSILKEIELHPTAWTFDLEFLIKARDAGHRIATIDIVFEKRRAGKSKINLISASAEIGLNAIKNKFARQTLTLIRPTHSGSMRGAGLAYRRKRFVTHTTLPHRYSAFRTFVLWQKVAILVFLLLLGAGAFIHPLGTAIAFTTVLSTVYFLDVVFNLFLVMRSLRAPPELRFSENELRGLSGVALPVYTILCPLYREVAVLPDFLDAIEKLDWPKQKLDVLLLLEEDDIETQRAVLLRDLPPYVRSVVVPASQPRTKPKACNYGLSLARGEYLVIFDAEDRPDPMQLRKAFLGFQNAAPDVRCLQAKLNYYNPHQNLLTRLFTAEYSLWFDVILTGIQSVNAIIPLGGTSNHFRSADLRELRGWDPFNVTEDCDLGVRLFKLGYKTAIIDSVTLEEANSGLGNWLRQRSRWIKGYIQTYLVHMRQPFKFARDTGRHAGLFQLIVGGKIAFVLINPFLWAMTVAYFALKATVGPTIEAIYPTAIFYMAVSSLVFGNFLFLYYYMIGCAKRGQWELIKYVFFVPVYWLLTSLAAFIALYQLFWKPHYWEKTRHGLHLPKSASAKGALDSAAIYPKAAPVRESWTKKVFASGTVLVGAMMLSNFLNFLYNAILGRELSLENLGVVSLVNTVLSISALFFGALGSTVNHRTAYLGALTADKGRVSAFLRSVRRRGFFVAVAAGIAWAVAVPVLTAFFQLPDAAILISFTPVLVIGLLGAINRGYLYGSFAFFYVAILYLVESASKLGFGVALAESGWEKYVYLSIPLSVALAAVVSEVMLRSHISLRGASSSSALQFPSDFFAASLMSGVSAVLFLNLDLVLVKHFLSPVQAGQYVLLSLVGKMIYFLGSLPVVFMVAFVSRAEGMRSNPARILNYILAASSVLTVGAFAVLGPLGGTFVPLLLGSRAAAILPYASLYGLAIALFTIMNVFVTYHLARRQFVFPALSLLVSALMSVGIVYSHESVAGITRAIFGSAAIGLALTLLLHSLEKELRFIGRAFSDLLGIFLPLPQAASAGPGKRDILIFNWRDKQHKFAGGAEVYIQEMAKRWVKEGNRVTLFCGNDGASPRSEIVDGIEVVRRGGFYLVYLWAVIYYLLRFRGNYDVVVDCQNGIPFFTPLYVREPVFCVMHHVHQEIFRRYLKGFQASFAMFLEKRVMPLVYRDTKFITVSNSTKNAMEDLGLTGIGIDIVHNGVDLRRHKPAPKSAVPMVLYVGRLKAYKSLDVLIRAFEQVKNSVQAARLVIAGSGEQDAWLRQFVRDLGLTDSVEFLGRVSDEDKILLMQGAWVFVNPSLIEGWGITTMEANACGTPVVGANVPGLRDSVINPHTGFLVPHGNSQAMAEKILEVIEDKSLRTEMSREAYRWAQEFDWERTSTKFLELVNQTVSLLPMRVLAKKGDG